MKRTEACVCGGTITADPADDAALTAAVRAHNDGPRHTGWRLSQMDQAPCVGYRGRGCLVMVPVQRLRCAFCSRRMREAIEVAA